MSAVWAMTRLTLFSAARRRTPIALILLAVVAGPALSMFLEGDLRLEGLIKTVLTWNITFVSGSIMLLTVFFASNLLGRDLSGKQLYMVDSKPIHRWQVLIGKWLGLTLLVGWLLLLAWGATFLVVFAFSAAGRVTMAAWGMAIVRWGFAAGAAAFLCWLVVGRILGRRRWGWLALVLGVVCAAMLVRDLRAVPIRHDARAADMASVRQRLLVARRSYRPSPPNIDAAVERRVAQIVAVNRGQDIGPDLRERIRDEVREELERRTWRIPFVGTDFGASSGMSFIFRGIPPEAVKFAPELVVRYQFLLRRGPDEGGTGWMMWRMPTRAGRTLVIPKQFGSRKVAEEMVPADVILNNGEVELQIINANPPTPEEPGSPAKSAGTMFVPLRDGLEILVPVGRFDVNLARGFLLLWIRMAMIALVGVSANTLVSGPVTALVLFAFLTVGLGNSYLIKEMRPDPLLVRAGVKEAPEAAKNLALTVAESVLRLAPNFEQTDPVADLVVGREIPWWRVFMQGFWDVVLRGGLAAVLGIWVFSRRELAKPTTVE